MKEQTINQTTKPELKHENRYWQKFRGWSVKFLDDLQNSGGKTTRAIADATFCPARVAAVILQRMWRYNLIEKIENWGWRLTRDGMFLLSINNNTVNNNNVNTKITDNKHKDNTKKQESIPSCFSRVSCHIKQLCRDKAYTLKNMVLCQNCVSFDLKNYTKGGTSI